MIGPYPLIAAKQEPLTDAERIKQLDLTINLKACIPKPPEPYAVFSSKLGRFLKPSRW